MPSNCPTCHRVVEDNIPHICPPLFKVWGEEQGYDMHVHALDFFEAAERWAEEWDHNTEDHRERIAESGHATTVFVKMVDTGELRRLEVTGCIEITYDSVEIQTSCK